MLTETGAEVASVTSTASVEVESTTVGKLLEKDLGVTVREALTNAGETGAQDVAMQAQEALAALAEGNNPRDAVAAVQAASG